MRALLGAMLIVAAMTGAAAAADDPRFLAFRTLCLEHPRDRAAMTAEADARGWHAVAPSDSAELANLLEQIVEPDEGDEVVTYRSAVGGSELFLVVKTYDDGAGLFFDECGVYDFGARAAVGRDDLTAWLGAPLDKGQDSRWVVSLYWPGPVAIEADWEINLVYNPPDGVMNSIDGFTGAALVSYIRPAD